MTQDQIVSFLVEIAESEPPDALVRVRDRVEDYLALNRQMPAYVPLKSVFVEFQRASYHISNHLSMQILEMLADRLPFGY